MMSQNSLSRLRPTDVPALAALHRRALPTFFLSCLGEGFLAQFYRGFVGDGTAVTVVAHDGDGRPVGAVVGTTEPAGFFRRLLRRRWLGFGIAALGAVARRPSTIPRLLRAVTYRGGAASPSDGALLSSVCVDPTIQGRGLGRELIEAWEAEAARMGAARAFLTTDAEDNDAVNAFYRSRGWSLEDRFVTREGRAMNRYTKRLDRTA